MFSGRTDHRRTAVHRRHRRRAGRRSSTWYPPRISRKAAWLPRAFDAVIAKAMARDPELRYQSCAEFVDHLTRVLR
ncbi:putative serine/threonine-kinase PknB domain protein [Mycobacterium xenopi 4042]|uniref:Putative serine/threonine-kinase PknB domain protein n=1 Tax=Mycobacterium xenopi 4042 TaxID=1299334 RepID=X8ADF4_MYCXE|nr:putative serine/threonine-kinase PknB domain protein [Mycobacterium xenopi 4042]EUA50668.1 putative serine/threonine-kinase PknB domain protein [Mycobacterium xenopi 3993]